MTMAQRTFFAGIVGMMTLMADGSVCMVGKAANTMDRSVEVIARFDALANEHPENVALGSDGALYVTLHEAARLWKRGADGQEMRFALPGMDTPRDVTRINGIVLDRAGRARVSVRSDDAAYSGVWAVDGTDTLVRVAAIPAGAGLNGMAGDAAGNLYIADDTAGCIWRVRPDARDAEMWLNNARLAPDPAGAPYPGAPVYGANGIKVFRGAIFVSSPSQARMIRVPITSGGRAGDLEEPYGTQTFLNVDDFAFDRDGNVYLAAIIENAVWRDAPNGAKTTLLTASDGLDHPTAVAFGVADADATSLYVTNAAFVSAPGVEPCASVLRVDVDISGASLQ